MSKVTQHLGRGFQILSEGCFPRHLVYLFDGDKNNEFEPNLRLPNLIKNELCPFLEQIYTQVISHQEEKREIIWTKSYRLTPKQSV